MKSQTVLILAYIVFNSYFNGVAQEIVINELMPSNGVTIADEDGDYSDWIELFNLERDTVDFTGYGLSDDHSNPFKWVMPQVSISPKDHLLIFASDKNRMEIVKHWETIINWGDIWKYRLGTSEPPPQWKNLDFDDQSWESGPSGFGYGDDDDATIVPSVPSVYLRKIFSVENVGDISEAVLHVDYDDAFVAYLNGTEIARANIGVVNVPPTYNESATADVEPAIVYGRRPESYIISDIQSLLQNGENVIAIQVHNYEGESSDLTLIPFLTLGMNLTTSNPNEANPLLDLPFKYLHTNFKLSSDGELVVITDPQGNMVDQVSFGKLGQDVSYGRQPDGSNFWYLFPDATPGDSNITQGYSGTAAEPLASLPGGFYFTSVTVNLTAGSANDKIYYTLNGSEPDETSQVYATPIQIESTKVIRAKAFSTGSLPSRTLTNTYFINFSSALPVISLSTNPGNLFDEEYGIYTLGDSAETFWPYYGANFWKDWERPVHVELFETNGSKGFSIDAGIQIFGAWARAYAQKSFAIFARGKYGYSTFNYKLFTDLPYTEYEAFVLRNSGQDWNVTMFRDALMTSLVDDVDIDKQDYRPAIIFINGEYWGMLNIREKVNEHFIAQHHNVNPDSVDILENHANVVQGNNVDYQALNSFIENNSMAIPANYEYIKTKMEVDNFIRYFISEIYFANVDWPGGNIKYWRNTKNGKWRWILYDTDWGFGLSGPNAFSHNTLEFATAANSSNESNPPWSTLFLRKLLENDSFKNDFINCFADYSNSIFDSAVVINKINSIKSLIEPEIPHHGARWSTFNPNEWLNNVQVLRDFASQRIAYMRLHFIQKFGLTGLTPVNLAISDTSMGSIKLNSLTINSANWSGNYFTDVPIRVVAQSKQGFRFVRWEGSFTSSGDSLSITLSCTLNLNAIFEADSNFSAPKVVINEINYNSATAFNTEDWIELYNNGEDTVDISGWIFKDSDDAHIFTIPQGTTLEKSGYLVLCIDTSLFKPLFPEVQNLIGNVGFGLSGSGELVRLYDNQMLMMDSLVYDDTVPWPSQPDGNGPTLSLKNPNLDNSLGENWAASVGNGTPGQKNDIFTDIPVELTSFTAEVQKKNVVIKWTTASEINNRGFFVERNITGNWESIHFSEGRGTITVNSSYEFIDMLPTKIKNSSVKYRLRQVNFDGSSTYSGMIEVDLTSVPDKFQLNQNYPNPFNPSTSIQYAISGRQFLTLKVYDLLGREIKTLVNEEQAAGFYEVEFNTSSLPSGTYFYRLIAGSFVATRKMVIIK